MQTLFAEPVSGAQQPVVHWSCAVQSCWHELGLPLPNVTHVYPVQQ